MSHIAVGKARIHDLDALKDAAANLGLEFIEGKTSFEWYGAFMNDSAIARDAIKRGYSAKDFGKCEHVLRLKGCQYEIGVKRAADGDGYVLQYDQFGSGHALMQAVGDTAGTAECPKLQDEYNLSVAARRLKKQGYKVKRQYNEETGEYQLVGQKA
jgi:hypothetical protein